MRTVFLTGGSGFVGKYLIPKLLNAGLRVRALARSEKARALVEGLGAEAVMGELTDSSSLARGVAGADFVIHSAAYLNFTPDPRPFHEINVEATRLLLEESRRAGAGRFVFISAAAVIADGNAVRGVDEDYTSPGLPSDLYCRTKLLAENLVREADGGDFRAVSLRPPLIWGPENAHVDEFREAVEKGQWRWIGGGEHVLSTCHIDNLIAAVLTTLDADLARVKRGATYFITDGEHRPLKDFLKPYLRAYGIEPGDKSAPRGAALFMSHVLNFIWRALRLKGRAPLTPGMVHLMGTELRVDDSRARSEIGYANAVSIDQGLERLRGVAAPAPATSVR